MRRGCCEELADRRRCWQRRSGIAVDASGALITSSCLGSVAYASSQIFLCVRLPISSIPTPGGSLRRGKKSNINCLTFSFIMYLCGRPVLFWMIIKGRYILQVLPRQPLSFCYKNNTVLIKS